MNRFDIFQESYNNSINVINRYLNFNLNECEDNIILKSLEAESKHLITWLFNLHDSINPYFPFFENYYGSLMFTAGGFDTLCGLIHHAIIDDGDICYTNKQWPTIAFKDRYDYKNWYYTKEDYRRENIINKIKPSYSLADPIFYENAYEFTEAFDQWIATDRKNKND
jgi:hypothetical protein